MVKVPLAWVRESSVTDTEKEAVPVAVGSPEIVPFAKLRPIADRLGPPELRVQMYPEPDPPFTASV
jgi:hypothetical protein